MTADDTPTDWLTTEEPPERLETETGAAEAADNDWFSERPFIPTPVGEKPDPDLDIELRWDRHSVTEEVGMTVTSSHGSETDESVSASEAEPESQTGQSDSATAASQSDADAATEPSQATGDSAATEPESESEHAKPSESVDAVTESEKAATENVRADAVEAAETADDEQSASTGVESDTKESSSGILSWLKAVYSETLKSFAGK